MRTIIGFALTFIGAIYLGASLSLWRVADFSVIAQLWPLLLVLIGLSILLKNWKYGKTVVCLCFILAIVFVFYVAVFNKNLIKNNSVKNSDSTNSSIFNDSNWPFGQIKNLQGI